MGIRKDRVLDRLAERGNVAQFIAFEPTDTGPITTFSRLVNRAPNQAPSSVGEAAQILLALSSEGSVNIRSFTPDNPQSREFVYGMTDPAQIQATIERLSSQGLYVIANETVDVADGGISGVVQGNVIEFSPDDTPRCVEKPGTVTIEALEGLAVLEKVYGFRPGLEPAPGLRTEFSIHPSPRGWRSSHTLLWEQGEGVEALDPQPTKWPNNFSRMVGDKAFGLLMAENAGLPVPATFVIGRRVAPFSFGLSTGSHEVWFRTCPREPKPGLYTTVKGWIDPFTLMANEDAGANEIASVLRQDAVLAQHSGAAIVTAGGDLVVEGRNGQGDGFMLGSDLPERLPKKTIARVHGAFEQLAEKFGPVRFEWVDDGARLWIVQLHVGATDTLGRSVVPGEASKWETFDARRGLTELRAMLTTLPDATGLVVTGGVGLTSHIADVLRKAKRPSRLSD